MIRLALSLASGICTGGALGSALGAPPTGLASTPANFLGTWPSPPSSQRTLTHPKNDNEAAETVLSDSGLMDNEARRLSEDMTRQMFAKIYADEMERATSRLGNGPTLNVGGDKPEDGIETVHDLDADVDTAYDDDVDDLLIDWSAAGAPSLSDAEQAVAQALLGLPFSGPGSESAESDTEDDSASCDKIRYFAKKPSIGTWLGYHSAPSHHKVEDAVEDAKVDASVSPVTPVDAHAAGKSAVGFAQKPSIGTWLGYHPATVEGKDEPQVAHAEDTGMQIGGKKKETAFP